MKKIISIFTVVALMMSLTGCLKDDPLNDFASTAKPILELPYHGLEGFSSDALLAAGAPSPFKVKLIVNLASVEPLSKDLPVTFAVDPALMDQYNASGAGLQYELLPDSTYTFDVKNATIKAGSRQDSVFIYLLTDKIDFTHNYMLPVKIADASGETISGNFGVAYYHLIGNPIAGSYTHEWLRWNGLTGLPPNPASVAPTFDEVYPDVFAPIDPTTISVQSGTGVTYFVSFEDNGGVLSNFSVAFPSSGPGSAADAGITITDGPKILVADPVNKKFDFYFNYLNASGAPRVIEDKFTP